MAAIFTDLIPAQTLLDIANARAHIVDRITEANSIITEADQYADKFGKYLFPHGATMRERLTDIIKEVDQRFWRHAIDKTGITQFMDAKAMKDFRASLEHEPPVFTIENVRATLVDLCQNADHMFARGLVELFLKLSKDYSTNRKEPFKVARKVVIGWIIQRRWSGGLEVRYEAGDKLNDIDRVMQTLAGNKFHPRSFETALNDKLKDRALFENDFYRARGYANGNLHLEFKRQDLLNKANKIIHEFYEGSALASRTA